MSPRWTRREFTSTLATLGLGVALPGFPKPGKAAPFKLGIITDEVAPDLEQALRFMVSYSIPYCELRTLWQKNLMTLTPGEMHRARQLIRKHGVKVAAIDSPLFKYDLPEMPAPLPSQKRDLFGADYTDKDTDDLLQRCFNLARFFGTSRIRVFSYFRVAQPEKAYPLVRERLAKAAVLAARQDMILMVENENVCNIGTSKELGRLVRDINSPHLRGNWDPANAAVLGEIPYPDGYREVRGLFAHMHIKDLRKDPQTGKAIWTRVGDGIMDYRGLLKALQEDRYEGVLSLETHYRRPDGNALESSRESLEGLRRIIQGVS
jgi:sugar phosphate isomerase/epimerase